MPAVDIRFTCCKTQQWTQDWKKSGQFSFQSQRKAMPKNVQLQHNCTTALGSTLTCYQGNMSCKDGSIKDRNGMDLVEAEDIKKRWQEYTKELYKKRSSRPR